MANTVGSGSVQTAAISACTSTPCHLGTLHIHSTSHTRNIVLTAHIRFVLKTKEQRAAEKALLDKSPLKTLTLEDFLESERHKLTGTLTPVTPETFAKWKKDRINKKAAEEQARKAKDNTGRALFESGKWADDDDSDADDDDTDTFNLARLRRETQALHEKREEERLMALHGPEAVAAAAESGVPLESES